MSTSSAAAGGGAGAGAGAGAAWHASRKTYAVRASGAAAWAVVSDWRMAWAGLADVAIISATERVINGDIFESLVELDAGRRTHAWSYDRVPAAWGIGEAPQMRGRVTVLAGAAPGECAVEYEMSAVPPAGDEAKIDAMLAHEAASVGAKLVAYIEARGQAEPPPTPAAEL